MRRILITNDDGIYAPGLARLAKAALKFGEVWVVAPKEERSAASHSITLRHPFEIHPSGFLYDEVHAFSCSGTPADCVRAGIRYAMPEKPDAVLAGINFGYNVGTDVQYSGTVAAALEGSFQGIPSIAFSETITGRWEVTNAYLERILGELIFKDPGPQTIWNVNFPDCFLADCGGVLYDQAVSEGMIYEDFYEKWEDLPDGGVLVKARGVRDARAKEGTDLYAVMHNYVSVGKVSNTGF